MVAQEWFLLHDYLLSFSDGGSNPSDPISQFGNKRKKVMKTAERRMFAKTIIDSDAFLDMPLSTQSLYFHLCMRADDDGFINNPKKIQRMIGASDDDLKVLMAKRFIIPFDSGIVVIKHWKIHNYIQKDRYKETVYVEEKSTLKIKDNKAYTLSDTDCIQDGYSLETQVRLGKDRLEIGKDSIEISNDISCPTLSPKDDEQYADVEVLPCTKDNFYRLTQANFDELQRLYPDVDIRQEFRNMRGWLNGHPKKTLKGMSRFINNWLSKSQNSASRNSPKRESRYAAIDAWGTD